MTKERGKRISHSRRVIFDEGAYKVQSQGQYKNSPPWSTILVLEPEEVEKIVEFKEERDGK